MLDFSIFVRDCTTGLSNAISEDCREVPVQTGDAQSLRLVHMVDLLSNNPVRGGCNTVVGAAGLPQVSAILSYYNHASPESARSAPAG